LTKEKEILAAKYETEVDELRTSQGVEIEKRDAEIRKLADLRELDYDKHAAELSVWRA
jgi:biotin operon repressor